MMSEPHRQTDRPEDAPTPALRRQLVAARRVAGLTQAEIARRLGVSPSRVSQLERRGTDATPAMLRRELRAVGAGFSLEITVHHHGAPLLPAPGRARERPC